MFWRFGEVSYVFRRLQNYCTATSQTEANILKKDQSQSRIRIQKKIAR